MSRITTKPVPKEPTYVDRFVWHYTPKCPHCGQRFAACVGDMLDTAKFYAQLLVPNWRVEACCAASA